MENLSVSQLNDYLKKIIMAQDGLRHVVVYGEISAFKFSGAHAYFNLKDQDSAIPCSCFNARKTYNPTKEGEAVLCTGYVDYYNKIGKLSLVVNTIQPLGAGKLHVQLEQLKAKLRAEGLFDDAHKKPIPPYCQNVCVITSKTGAVIRDIVRTVRLVNPILNIDVYDVRVQGDSASAEMCKALNAVDDLGYDCLILARGGGSLEDLMPFNDETLARVIYALNTPIISAVGHQTDFSISDFVADARAATPTAAGTLVGYNVETLRTNIVQSMAKAYRHIEDQHSQRMARYTYLVQSISDKTLHKLALAKSDLLQYTHKLSSSVDHLIVQKEALLQRNLTTLSAVNPVRLLQNGYCKLAQNGQPAQFDSINVGDSVQVIGYKGTLSCTVQEKAPMVSWNQD